MDTASQYGGGSEPEDIFLALLFPLSVLFLTALPEGSRSALSSTPLPFLSVGQTEEEPLLTACSGWKLGLVFCGQIKAFSRLPDKEASDHPHSEGLHGVESI